jgi:UDP-2,3-diacylglucosamine pyrophosphatase LpxH
MSVCSDVEFRDNQKIIYMSHGDEIELGNPGQKIFKKVVTSLPLRIFANNFMPYFLITKVGEFSSEKSRNRNQQRYSKEADMTAVRDNFRKSAEVLGQKRQCNIIVLGHSHVKDHYQSPYEMEYINNGYLQHSKTYICIENGNCTFKKIED